MPGVSEFLEKLGLSKKEIKVFLVSLQCGPQTASTVSKKTGMPRSTVNFIFETLIKKGIASKSIAKNTTYFSVVQPESIEYLLLEKQASAKKQLADFREILPLLNDLNNKASSVPKVRYFEGFDSMCRMVDETCQNDQQVLFVSGPKSMHPKLSEYIENVYVPVSKKHANKNRMIIIDSKNARDYAKSAKDAYEKMLFVQPEEMNSKLTMAIFDNKTLFASYHPDDMTGVIIENQFIADHMKGMFEMLWGNIQKR